MMSDIRRICENPTDEDRSWFPSLANTDWLTSLDFAMRNFKDENFITQYPSPNLIRRFKLFSILDDDLEDHVAISAIHDEYGYLHIRNKLAEQYNIANVQPDIKVVGANRRGNRCLTLSHTRPNRRVLDAGADEVLKHVARLWGFDVRLKEVDASGNVAATREAKSQAA
jgi:stage V sporulation protein R